MKPCLPYNLVLVATLLLLLPIKLIGAETEGYQRSDKLPIVDFVGKGFLSYVGKFPGHGVGGDKRVKYMLETFGQPVKIEKLKKEDWREPGLIRDHIIRYFDGVIIETSSEVTYRNQQQFIEYIRVITLENPKYTAYKGIKIGMPFSEFTKLLKLEDKKIRNDSITYYISNPHTGGLQATIFVSQKGVITKIVWDYLHE